MFVVDTNVLLYAAEKSFPEHERCRDRLLEWRRQHAAWYVTWSILYEFTRVATHAHVFRRPWSIEKAWQFVQAVLASPALGVLTETDRHPDVAAEILAATPHVGGNLVYDARTAVLMREHGVRAIYTRDTDFHRFPFLEVLDPLA